MWEKDININEVKEIISRAKVYFGVGAMHKIDDILKDLKSKGADKVIVISGRNAYKATGAWDIIEKALKDNNVGYVNYDKVTPNPTTDGIDEAKKIALDFGAKALGATAIPMSAGNTKRQMMCMEDLGATAFACTPSYALYLAESLQEAGAVDRLKLKAGIHGAEPWTEEMRKKIESILHINCFDIYGLCEVTGPGVAQDCIHHAGLHVHEDYFYPEVLDPTTHEKCADGQTGELVFTTLAKEAMPLIRYRTKDLTSIDHSTCECGRTLPRISKFTGRTDDMKVIRGVNVFPTQVETALLSMGGAVAPHYMMIVDREDNMDVLTVMVEVDERMFSDEIRKLDALRNKIAAVLKTALGISVRVKLVEPKSIQRSEGKAVRVIDNRNL